MARKRLALNEKSKGLWHNIHAKRKRGEKMNPKGHPDAPSSKEMKMAQEAIQRRMDRMVIIATDPATGRKVVKIAPKKEIEIGKGKQESYEDPIMGLFLNEERFITEGMSLVQYNFLGETYEEYCIRNHSDVEVTGMVFADTVEATKNGYVIKDNRLCKT